MKRMREVPQFFVPGVTPGKEEERYADLAKLCGFPLPASNERIYSATFTHNGEVWIATVGEPLCGTKYQILRTREGKRERTVSVNDPAVVLAIFAGPPCMAVTDEGILRSTGSKFANPFIIGESESVTCFATAG